MFYNSCEFVCPMLIDTMRITEQELSPQERSHLNMLLMTFDPARDNVAALKSVADKHELDATRWTLARPDATGARKIASTLGIQYRLLSSGEFNHTTVVVLLDGDGRILGRTRKLGAVDPEFLALVKQAAK
jgi:protein SCO1/2